MISIARRVDAEQLRVVAISAFKEDRLYRPPSSLVDGPPEHDAIESHQKWIQERHYLKYEQDNQIVAGCVVKQNAALKNLGVVTPCWQTAKHGNLHLSIHSQQGAGV